MEGIIPPSYNAKDEGWIRSDQLILPLQPLAQEEIEPFLDFLFREIARKPKQLQLKETARVARYLKAVAWEAQPSPERDGLDRLATMIWLAVLQSGRIEVAQKQQAIQFLKEHARTYLAAFDVERIVEHLEKLKEPSRHAEFFRPPRLMGAMRSASSKGPARLQDDLTERIYVSYHALRRARVRNARGRMCSHVPGGWYAAPERHVIPTVPKLPRRFWQAAAATLAPRARFILWSKTGTRLLRK